jgi:hypothetical protein
VNVPTGSTNTVSLLETGFHARNRASAGARTVTRIHESGQWSAAQPLNPANSAPSTTNPWKR